MSGSNGLRWIISAACVAVFGFPFFASAAPPEFAVARIDEQLGTTGLSYTNAVNENGDACGYVYEWPLYLPVVYTYEHGAVYLPLVPGHPEAVALDLTDRDEAGEIIVAGTAGNNNFEPTVAVTVIVFWRYSTISGEVVEVGVVEPMPGRDSSYTLATSNKKLIGYSRDLGFTAPIDLMVYEFENGTLDVFTFPVTPTDINNFDALVGGTFLGDLSGAAVDVGLPPSTTSAEFVELTDGGWAVASAITPYVDPQGRFIRAVARYNGQWELLWANSAFDFASSINDHGDVVGMMGTEFAIRPMLFLDSDQTIYRINDLVTPSQPVYFSGVSDINNQGQVAMSLPASVLTPLGQMIIPGDVNGDAEVRLDDLCAWLAAPVDLDGDADADADDYQWLLDRLAQLGWVPQDCNGNGTPDTCDILEGTSNDCNEDGIPDECQPDCDADGVPDDCESDCNANGIPDDCDLAAGTSHDCNENGIPDECDAADTVTVVREYDPPELLIPESTFTDSLLVTEVGQTADVDFTLDLDYRIGDLIVRLTHAGQTVTLIDRPGYPANPTGFSQVGYRITLDDEGTGGLIEQTGFPHGPFEPIVSPPSYVPNEPLATFDGLPREGTWTVEVITLSGAIADPKITSWGVIVTDVGVPVGACDGDLNCDGVVNAFDIDPFILALTDPAGYAAQYPDCDVMAADIDDDGVVNAFDIDPFIALLTGG